MIIVVGIVSIVAGVLYTGGPRPYGYAGMGELFVFLFFGLVAVNGSYYVQLEEIDALPVVLSVAVGFLSTAILVVNNLRDMDTDERAGKRTLAVRMGRERTQALYFGAARRRLHPGSGRDRLLRRAGADADLARSRAARDQAASARCAPAPTALR